MPLVKRKIYIVMIGAAKINKFIVTTNVLTRAILWVTAMVNQ